MIHITTEVIETLIEMQDKEGVDFHKRIFDKAKLENPLLVEAVQKLGAKANGLYATLKIVEIPDEVEWRVDAVNGKEIIREKHRMWS